MMIFRLSCPQHMGHVISNTAVRSQSWPIFIVYLKVRDTLLKNVASCHSEERGQRGMPTPDTYPSGRDASTATEVSMTEDPGYCFPDKRPISRSKNLAESTSAATLELGTNL